MQLEVMAVVQPVEAVAQAQQLMFKVVAQLVEAKQHIRVPELTELRKHAQHVAPADKMFQHSQHVRHNLRKAKAVVRDVVQKLRKVAHNQHAEANLPLRNNKLHRDAISR